MEIPKQQTKPAEQQKPLIHNSPDVMHSFFRNRELMQKELHERKRLDVILSYLQQMDAELATFVFNYKSKDKKIRYLTYTSVVLGIFALVFLIIAILK